MQRSVKSLFIVNDFPPIVGGQSTYLYNLVRAFPADKVIVLAPYQKNCEDFDMNQEFAIIRKHYLYRIPIIEKLLKIIIPLFHTRSILEKTEIKHIHCAHVLSTGVMGLILNKIFKQSYYVYTYSADIMEYQKFFLIKSVLVSVLKNATKVVAISEYNKIKLLELGVDEGKIIKIMPKIDFQKFCEPIDHTGLIANYKLQNKKILLSVNRLVERKGNDSVIKVLAKVKEKVADVVYLIVGSGEYENRLKELVDEYNLKNEVIFIPNASDKDVLGFYDLCDVFIMLSREMKAKGDAEGFGIVFLEANACKKPVIGGNSGGIPDAVVDGETGILVDPLDIDQISDVVVKMLSDKEYASKLGENGYSRARDDFDWRCGIKEIEKLGLIDEEVPS